MKKIPKTVKVLGWASFFTDVAGEGIASIMPIFLSQVLGAGSFALGLIEGTADTTASLLKVFSGLWSDRSQKRKPLILWGYGLAAVSRPLIGLAGTWPAVLALRCLDRVGKGVRSSPRDALITDVTSPKNRGSSFGFHGAMDHAGNLLGPLLVGVLLLPFTHLSIRTVIFLSIIPSLAAILVLALGIRENRSPKTRPPVPVGLIGHWKGLGRGFKTLLFILFLFSLGNSTDAFLLLWLSQVGIPASGVALLWGVLGGVKMLSSYYGGRLSDRIGRKPVIITGWMYYALIYLAFALVSSPAAVIAVFLAYGVYYGLCEPSEKAFVADLAPRALRGTSFGYYNLVLGIGALPASLIFGAISQRWGYPPAFITGAVLAGAASILLLLFPVRPSRPR